MTTPTRQEHAPNDARQPFAPEDLFLEQRITSVDLVRGQPTAVCAVKSAVRDADDYTSVLWIFPLDGGQARQLTWGPARDESPRWSPDGERIAFLSDRGGGKSQIHVMPFSGGESRALTELASGVADLRWRPDGEQLLVLCGVAVDPDSRGDTAQPPDPKQPARPAHAPEVVWRLPYKADGEGYTLAKRMHLFLVDAASGRATPLTRGDMDVRGFTWSPDGRHIAYVATRTTRHEEHCSDLWVLTVDDEGEAGKPRRLSHDQANVSDPAWSPDGRRIAFAGSVQAGDAQNRLWLCEVDDAHVQPLGDEDLEIVPGGLHWRGNDALMFIQAHRGIQRVARIGLPKGTVQPVDPGARHVGLLAVAEHMVYTLEGPDQARALYSAGLDGGNERCIGALNGWWDERILPEVHYRAFEVPDGDGGTESIDGWLLLPPGRKGPVPLLLDVHGGPASYALVDFPTHVHWQILCSRGWAVLALNPVGSSSYGRAFAERLRRRWGELDCPQQRAAVQQLQQEGVADARVAIGGSSYGGYLSAYAIGECELFRAAVVCAPVGNLETHFGTSDSGYYADPYSMDGKPGGDRDLMIRLSPMARIETACTPTLFLQGKEDERCPKCQSEELFVKLRTAGDTLAEMVLYPDGSHHVFGEGRPSHRLDIQQRIVDWLTRWIDQPLPSSGQRAAQAGAHRGSPSRRGSTTAAVQPASAAST